MKSFLKIGLVIAIFLTAAVAQANDDIDFSLKVKNEKGKTINFFINEAKDINLSIYGDNSEVFYQESIHSVGAFTKSYDLNKLPDGHYTFKVESQEKSTEYEILIANDVASVSKAIETEVFKPVLIENDQFIKLNLRQKDKSEVEVQIFNEYDEELYTKVFNDNINLKFDLSQTDARFLTFVVKSKDQSFSKTVRVR